jgi:hypothetical protein
LVEEDLLLRLGLGVATEHQVTAISGRQMDVDHLNGGEVFDGRPWRLSRCQWPQARLEGDQQAIGEKGEEDVRLDARIMLMVDGADPQIALEFLECLLDTPSLRPL